MGTGGAHRSQLTSISLDDATIARITTALASRGEDAQQSGICLRPDG